MAKQKYYLGFLILVILTSSVYIMLPDSVRIDIEPTKSTFKVWENDSWVISGVEYVNLFDGAAKMRAKNRSIISDIFENTTIITRTASYKNNILVVERYLFNGNNEDVTLFPVNHSIEIIGADRPDRPYILQYEVQKLLYSGETIGPVESPQSFGHKMEVEWDDGNYYSRIYKYSGKDEGKLTVKYRIDSDRFLKNVRLFDPPWKISLNTGLQNWYYSNETAGSIAIDTMNNNNGTLTTITLNQSGLINGEGVWGFDSSSSSFWINGGTISTGPSTTSYWIKTTSGVTNRIIFYDADGVSPGRANYYNNGGTVGKIKIRTYDVGGIVDCSIESTGAINDGEWHHIVSGLNSTACFIYIDGKFNVSSVSTTTTTRSNNDGWRWGDVQDANSGVWDLGIIGIWTRSLTQDEITNLYNDGSPLIINISDITLNSPSNNYASPTALVTFNASAEVAVGDTLENMSLWSNETGSWAVRNITTGLSTISHTQTWSRTITDTTLWNIEACDNNGDCWFAISNYTVFLDNVTPQVSIIYPANTTYSINVSDLNYTASDDYQDKCWYSNDSGATNQTPVSFGTNFTDVMSIEGTNTWIVYCNDTGGLENSSNVTFTKDTLFPLIDYSANSDATNSSGNFSIQDWVFINVTVTEVSEQNITFRIFQSGTLYSNTTFTNSTRTINYTSLSEGMYFWNVTVCDSAGRCNSTATRNYGVEITNVSLALNFSNIIVELGGDISINATNTLGTVYVDVDHPSYGTNYSSGIFETVFDIIINWFRKTIFTSGNSSEIFNFTSGFGTDENMTFNVSSHQYDEVVNLSVNVSGINSPYGVAFYKVNSSTYDRVFYGNLTGDYVWQEKLVNKGFTPYGYNKTQNITFDNAGEKYLYFYMDNNAKLVNFLLNITSTESGYYYNDSFANWSNIDTVLTDAQLDISRVIMSKNASLLEFSYDDFEDSSIDLDRWIKTDDYSASGSGYSYSGTISESSGYLRLFNEWDNSGNAITGSGTLDFSPNSTHFTLYDSNSIIFNLSNSYSSNADNVGCSGNAFVYLGTTTIWTSYYEEDPDTGSNQVESSTANLIFNLTKYNSTSWRVQISGVETSSIYDADTCGTVSGVYNWTSGIYNISKTSCANTNGTLDNDFYAPITYGSTYPFRIRNHVSLDKATCESNNMDTRIYWVNNSLYSRSNSTIVSESVFDSSGNIPSATMNVAGTTGPNENVTFYMSADNGDNWQNVLAGVNTPFGTPGKNLKWKILINMTDEGYKNVTTLISRVNITVSGGNLSNVTFDVGDDGTIDYTISGNFTSTNGTIQVNLTNASLSSAFTGTPVVGHTYAVPVVVNSDSAGQLNIDWINLSYNPNPIFLNYTAIQNYLTSFGNGITTIPMILEASGLGSIINLTDLRFDYAGGNSTINVLAHNADYSQNVSRNITYYYSRWDYEWGPSNVEWIYFAPNNPTSVNVTPYGQSSTVPIINITNYGYGGENATLSIYQNGTQSCVNTTMSLTNNKSAGFLLNNSWIELTNLTYLETTDIYLWADYNCSFNTWNLFEPQYYFRQCVNGGSCSTDLI